jgi:DNA polymerase-3 subunit gamma/tau
LAETHGTSEYLVLARKYRPATFTDLRGQEAMVRTLKNAFESNRIAHAFILTGLRGIGKTTTARIIAKGLNCIGPDGNGGPTTEPCGECEPCQSITAGNHVDVLEMDAASRTGVNDIREIIDSVNYRAASARFKVYIIDEVHMLSTQAFNALLKTLEEPPEHVKFIFATTEIRKVPVTVLSRCQRFDLRRFEPEVMIEFLKDISNAESAQIADDALALITRAAEGSARDALSLLDQALSHGAGETTAEQVRAMLGLADRGRVLDLLEYILRGEVGTALQELAAQYADGADPMAILRDLAEVTHWVSVVKISPETSDDPTVSPDERTRGLEIAQSIPMRVLTRMWQMLLKALDEVAYAPNAMMAAEMAVIRLTHVSDLPTPDDLVRKLKNETGFPSAPSAPAPGSSGGGPAAQARSLEVVAATAPQPRNEPQIRPSTTALARFQRFEDVVGLVRSNRDVGLLIEIETNLRLVSYEAGRIEFEPTPNAANDLAQRLARNLQAWTGSRWAVSVVQEGGGKTIAEVAEQARNDLVGQSMAHPLVQSALDAFPGAKISNVRVETERDPLDPATPMEEMEENWDPLDPFEETD